MENIEYKLVNGGSQPYYWESIISKNDYDDIEKYHYCVGEYYNIENKYNIVIENYREFESEILNLSLSYSLHAMASFDNMNAMFWNIQRKLFNLLNSCDMFVEHCLIHYKHIQKKEGRITFDLKSFTNKLNENHFSYRVLDKIRNHSQHYGIPVQKVNFGSKRDYPSNPNRVTFPINLFLKPDLLRQNSGFPKHLISEIEQQGEVDIKPLIREYLSLIYSILKKVRDELALPIIKWKNKYDWAVDLYRNDKKREPDYLFVMNKDGEKINLYSQWLLDIDQLVTRNNLHGNLINFVISNE